MNERPLSFSELDKHEGVRWKVFLNKLLGGQQFELEDGRNVVIRKDRALKQALSDRDPMALRAALARAKFTDETGETTTGMTVGMLSKSSEFGGRAKTADRVAGKNESQLAMQVNKLAKHGPVTVKLGRKRITGVIGAEQTGEKSIDGQTSKADVVFFRKNGRDVGVSIKMKQADYYLSGDRQLAPYVGPIIKKLIRRKAPRARIVANADNTYSMVKGDARRPTRTDLTFDVPPDVAEKAVFGSGNNRVDFIARGDFIQKPVISGNVISWPDVEVYTSIDDLPENEHPVGLLRYNSGRGVTYNGVKYLGIRPAIVTAHRARNATHV